MSVANAASLRGIPNNEDTGHIFTGSKKCLKALSYGCWECHSELSSCSGSLGCCT